MMRGLAIIGTLFAACCLASGCSITGTGACGPGHGACGPCGGCDSCGVVASACDCGHCDDCLGHPTQLMEPVRRAGQRAHHALTCGAGCGEIYWGEWISDPPDHCDPCDCDGHWTGAHCDRIPLLDRLHFLWNGYRYHGDCEPGCTTCGDSIHAGPVHGGTIHAGPVHAGPGEYIVEEGTYLPGDDAYYVEGELPRNMTPTPAPSIVPRGSRAAGSPRTQSALRRPAPSTTRYPVRSHRAY